MRCSRFLFTCVKRIIEVLGTKYKVMGRRLRATCDSHNRGHKKLEAATK